MLSPAGYRLIFTPGVFVSDNSTLVSPWQRTLLAADRQFMNRFTYSNYCTICINKRLVLF